MLISSEYVTLGHPDRLADALAANLITRIQKKDDIKSHAAIEVFLTNDTIIFGGEATTTLKINKKLLKEIVEETFKDCGYDKLRRIGFDKKEVKLAKDSKIVNKIHAQSKDIAMATTDLGEKSGFNDQGIFYSGYDSMTPTGQGIAKYFAQSFGEWLFHETKLDSFIGSDIKTIFTIDLEKDMYTPKSITNVTVAIPVSTSSKKQADAIAISNYDKWVKHILADKNIENYKYISKLLSNSKPNFIVNGTGKFTNHGYAHDTSMCGRKLAVNNMSAGPVWCQNQIGGGSYIKPFHASDFLLPMVCTWISHAIVSLGYSKYANVALSCSIGQTKPDSICVYGDEKFNSNTKLCESIVDFVSSLDLSPNGLWSKREWDKYNLYEANKYNFTEIPVKCSSDNVVYKTAKDGTLTKIVNGIVTPWYDMNSITTEMKLFLKERKL